LQFQRIIGQEEAKAHVLDSVRNNRLPHAILLKGPSGTGKLAFANAIAQYINCLQPGPDDSCGRCTNCIRISKGLYPDIRYILPIISKKEGGRQFTTDDYIEPFRKHFFSNPYFGFEEWQAELGGENKQLWIAVHEIRELKRGIYLKAFEGKYKIVIVWNAERINVSASNAFLKLLEEPPDKTLILMTCSDPTQLLTTIYSRCQQIQLRRIPTPAIRDYLMRERSLPEDRALELATLSEGSIGNANTFLGEDNQAMLDLYINWLRAVYVGNYALIRQHTGQICDADKEFQKLFLSLALAKMRDALLFHTGTGELALVTQAEKDFHQKFSDTINLNKVDMIASELEQSRDYLGGNANARMVFAALSLKIHQILRGNY
jgi:DNA polymerase-3 subunit delta'